MRTKRIKIVEKWAAGWDCHENLIVTKGKFRVTKKLLIRQAGTIEISRLLNYRSRFPKDDPQLHDTRRAAINRLLMQHNSQLQTAYKALKKIHSRIRTIIGELAHDPSTKMEEAGDPAADESPESRLPGPHQHDPSKQ